MAMSADEEVTLMDWGDAIVKTITEEQGGITAMTGILHLEGSVKTTKLKLTWLPDTSELVSLILTEFDYLIKMKKKTLKKKKTGDRKPGDEDEEDYDVNELTKKEVLAFGVWRFRYEKSQARRCGAA